MSDGPVDYEQLLLKYIGFVGREEGTAFVERLSDGCPDVFTPVEIEELKRLDALSVRAHGIGMDNEGHIVDREAYEAFRKPGGLQSVHVMNTAGFRTDADGGGVAGIYATKTVTGVRVDAAMFGRSKKAGDT